MSRESPTASVPSGQLKRQLGLWDAIAIFVGIILGSGIFWTPAQVAGAAPGVLAAAGLWLVGGLVAACGAFCYAECGARLPRTGGFYVFYREVHGELVAFIGGWAALLITYPASIAVIALIFSEYLSEALPFLPEEPKVSAAGAILIAGFLNTVGVRRGAMAQRILTGVKVSAIVMLCVAALATSGGSAGMEKSGSLLTVVGDPKIMLAALVGLLWTYDGWSDVTLVAGEIRRPGRNIGRAVILGTSILVIVYVMVQVSVQTLLPPDEAAASSRVFADAVQSGLGDGAGRAVAILIVVSTLGSINGIVLTASRLGYAMARDGTFLPWFGQVHPRWGTPARSLSVLVAASLFYVFSSDFRKLLFVFSFSVWIFYGLTAVALVVLRKRGVGEPVEWRAPGGWIAPIVVLVTATAMTSGLAYQDPGTAAKSIALLAIGLPVYGAWRWIRGS